MSPAPWTRIGAAVAAFMMLAFPIGAQARLSSDAPLDDVGTIRKLMDSHPHDDVHLILIHGIRTSDRTTWDGFRGLICAHLPGQCLSAPDGPITERLMLRDHAPDANFLGQDIWPKNDPQAWIGSQPFIDHYRLSLTNDRVMTIDEINWWPLAFAFKCQFIVKEDTELVGPAQDNITFCAENSEMHFPWFDAATKARLLALRPVSGGAPLANRMLKTGLLDWGISDAVLAEGNLKGLLRETVRCAFSDIGAFDLARFDASGRGRLPGSPSDYTCPKISAGATRIEENPKGQFVVISHSLGAFIVLDTFADAAAEAVADRAAGKISADSCAAAAAAMGPMAAPEPNQGRGELALQGRTRSLCAILARSDRLYFLANQFALMELGRAQGLSDFRPSAGGAAQHWDALSLWGGSGAPGHQDRQIVAFSDPGDILTLEVPCIRGARVINVYAHNATDWFGLFELPGPAHDGYLTSDDVLGVLFGYPRKSATVRPRQCPAGR